MVVGYKKTIAYNAGYRLLKKDEVQAELKRLIDSRSQEINIDVRRIVDEYLKIAFADISDLLVFKGDLLTLKSSTEVDTSVISEVRQNRSGVSIKLHDKTKALEKLERYVNYMTEEERLKIDKMRAEIAILNGGGDGKEEGDDGFIDALKGTVSEAWNDDEPKEDNDG